MIPQDNYLLISVTTSYQLDSFLTMRNLASIILNNQILRLMIPQDNYLLISITTPYQLN